jgi:hypothetical protein
VKIAMVNVISPPAIDLVEEWTDFIVASLASASN